MKNPVLDRIQAFAIKELQGAYGYVGNADADDMCMLNSGKDTNIIIKITEKKD